MEIGSDNKQVPLGMIHISLPFKSMDDVEFSGQYGQLADSIVQTLQDHLAKHKDEQETQEDTSENTDNSDNNEDSVPDIVQYNGEDYTPTNPEANNANQYQAPQSLLPNLNLRQKLGLPNVPQQ